MSTANKLPKGLPDLPPVPEGFVLKYEGRGVPGGIPAIYKSRYEQVWFCVDGAEQWEGPYVNLVGDLAACHYIRAIKRPAKLKKPSNEEKIDRALAMVAESRPRMNAATREQRAELEARGRAIMAEGKKPKQAKAVKADKLVMRAANQAARAAVKEIEAATGQPIHLSVCMAMVQQFGASMSSLGIASTKGRT
jgi:hypothetical protein